ncbi:MAG: hypothetical protein AAGI49_16620 [Bacteroidota bacterium]
MNVADNVTKSVLTIGNPQDADSQTFDIQLVATNPCGIDMEIKNNIVGLPVELIYFDAKALEDYTLLTWETVSEQNNDFFAIERSYDAINFESIGKVQGAGTSIEAEQYEFVNRTVDVSQEEVYYRLQQVD